MNLDRLAAVMRPRANFESVDLGFQMLRAWWRPVAGAWAAAGFVLAAIVMTTMVRWPVAALVLVWWVKPLLARVPVFVLSRGLFGEVPGSLETLRAWPRQLLPGLLASLTWLRFDPIRALRTPVLQLEGLRGASARRRLKILAQDMRFDAALLTLTCVLFELCLFLGLLGLLLAFYPLPEIIAIFSDGAWSTPLPLHQRWMLVGFYAVASTFVEAFHAAGGFGLYINRRTHLEAWDIEVRFRRMRSRLRSVCTWSATAAVVLAIASGMLVPLTLAGGMTTEATADGPSDPAAIIADVLADPIFGTEITESRWIIRPVETSHAASSGFPQIGLLIAWALRTLVAILLACGLIWGIYRFPRRRSRSATAVREASEHPAPTELVGLDVRAASLPEDVAGQAGELWDAGSRREALRLLYRGALSGLISRDGLPLKASSTEEECVGIAEGSLPTPRANYFRLLTEAWQITAYGHRELDDARRPQLIGEWNAHFGKMA